MKRTWKGFYTIACILCLLCFTALSGCGAPPPNQMESAYAQKERTELSVTEDTTKQEKEKHLELYSDNLFREKSITNISAVKGDINQVFSLGTTVYIYSTSWSDTIQVEDSSAENVNVLVEEGNGNNGYIYEYIYALDLQSADQPTLNLLYTQCMPDTTWLTSFCVGQDESLYQLYTINMDGEGTVAYTIKKEGKEESTTLELVDPLEGDDSYLINLLVDEARKQYYLCGDRYVYGFDYAGNKVFSVEMDGWISGLISSNSDSLLCQCGTDYGTDVYEINLNETEKKASKMPVHFSYNEIVTLFPGQKYLFNYYSEDGIYGFDAKENEFVQLVDGNSENIKMSTYGQVCELSNGDFFANTYEFENETQINRLRYLQKLDPSEVTERIPITLSGVYVSDKVRQKVLDYNDSQDKYRVIVKDYMNQDYPYQALEDSLYNGEASDLVFFSGVISEKFITQDLFLDLYPYMEQDSEIQKEDFYENILTAFETDGKLYHLSPFVDLCAFIGRKKDIERNSPFTIQDLIEVEKSYGEKARSFYFSSGNSVVNEFVCANPSLFLDWKNKVCHFDTEEFSQLLEYGREYPTGDEDAVWSYDNESQEEMVRNKHLIFTQRLAIEMLEIPLFDEIYGEEVAFIGYPNSVSNGLAATAVEDMAISKNCENPEGAWEFLRTFYTQEQMTKDTYENGYGDLPIRKDAFDALILKNSSIEYYTDSLGIQVDTPDYGYYDVVGVDVGAKPLSKEDGAKIRTIMRSVDHLYEYDYDLAEIISSQTAKYYEGQISAQDTVNSLQELVSEYMKK